MALALLEDFVNTRSVELGADELGSPADLARWLATRELLPVGAGVSEGGHERALVVREGIRALAAANNAEPAAVPPDLEASFAALARLAPELPLVLDVAVDVGVPSPRLVPAAAAGTVDAALASLLSVVAAAVADGSWARFKACREPGCRWVYVDASRNRSRAWCSMATCGNRAKARAFRRRSTR